MAQLRQLVERGESRSQVVRKVVPPLIAKSVFQDNLRFLRDQQIYTSEHFTFFADLMRAAVPLVEPVRDFTESVRIHTESVGSDTVVSDKDPIQYGARVIDLGTQFWLDTLSHAADMDKQFADISDSLIKLYGKHVPSCKLLLDRLTRHSTYIDDLLLQCNKDVVRTSFVQVVDTVIQTLTPFEQGMLLERDDEGRPVSLVARFFDVIIDRMGEARKNWPRFNEYFSLYECMATTSQAARAYMIDRRLISKLLDFFLGDASPIRPHDAPKEGPLGNSVMQPKYEHLMNTVVRLLECVRLSEPGADGGGGGAGGDGDDALLPALEDDVKIIRSFVLYKAAMKTGAFMAPLTKIMATAMRNNMEFSEKACNWLVNAFESASYDSAKTIWTFVRHVVALDDGHALRRVAMILGDPLIGTVAAGAGLGLPPLAPVNGAAAVSPAQERERREALQGVGKGVLAILRRRQDTSERFVYNSIKQLVNIADDVPTVTEYLSRLPPEDPANEDRYTDWMFRFLRAYTNSQASYTPVVQPARLARQQSGIDTFKSFVKLEKTAELLTPGSASARRFERKNVDMVLAMQASRLVTHSQANQSTVVCDMREFRHPVTGNAACYFQVKTRLAKPVNFELTFSYPKNGNQVNFTYPEPNPLVCMVPAKTPTVVYISEKIDPTMPTWGAYLFNWKYKLVPDPPKPHEKANTNPDDVPPAAGGTAGPAGGDAGPPAAAPAPATPNRPANNSPARRAPTPVPAAELSQWACPRCTFLNMGPIPTCEMCGAPRPSG